MSNHLIMDTEKMGKKPPPTLLEANKYRNCQLKNITTKNILPILTQG